MLKAIKHYIFEIALVVAMVSLVITVLITAYAAFTYDRVDKYSRVYVACMKRETLSHEQCHDIALDETR